MSKYNTRKDVPEKYKWDLSDFFKGDEEFYIELDKANKLISKYSQYKGKLKDGKTLYELLSFDTSTSCLVENLLIYSYLKADEELGNKNNIDRKNKAVKLVTEYSNAVSFINPEILSLNKKEYDKLFEYKLLSEYKFMLDEIYKNKDHILSENEEIIINELLGASDEYEDMLSNLLNNEHDYGKVLIDGKEEEIHSTNIRKIMQNKDVNVRKDAFFKLKSVRDKYAGTCASLLNSYVKTNNTLARLRHFNNAFKRKLFYRNFPKEAYDVLIKTVRDNYKYSRKYYKLVKETNNLNEIHTYDMNLTLYSSKKNYSIDEGIDLIKKALQPLGEDYLKCFDKIIKNKYIDFCEYKGKTSGGYSACAPDKDSRILLSYNDDLESVSTVIHECGHNIHDQFIHNNNPIQYREVTTLVAEVASLTNECLLSSYLANNGSKEEKLEGISNILNVIECNLFDCIREAIMEFDFNKYSEEGNALTKEYLNELNLESLKEYLKDTVIIDEYANTGWISRRHYYCDYYLCDYSFCISVACANALRILSGDKEAIDRYKKFLSLGGDVYPIDAIKVLGFDLRDSKVYEDAIKYFDSLIEEYKKISKE
jgi:oligoendopeptidase F